MNFFKLTIACLLCFVTTLCLAQQPTKEELQKQKSQIQKEIDDLKQSLNSLRGDKSKAIKAYQIAVQKIQARERLIYNINKQIKNLDEVIFQNEREIYRLKIEADTLRKQYAQSIVFAYKNRSNYNFLNFLFSATNFSDAIKRMIYLKSYRRLRETQAQTIAKTQLQIQQKISDLNTNKNEMNQALVTQTEQMKDLQEDKKDKDQAVKQLKDQEKELNVQLRKREKQRQELNRAIDLAIKREIAEAERKAKLERQKALEEKRKAEALAKAKAAEDAKNNKANTKPSVAVTPVSPETGNKGVATNGNNARSYNALESTPENLTTSINFENSKGKLPWPVSNGNVLHHFGREYLPTMIIENNGIIISVPVGTNVKCVADGEVIAVMDLSEYQAVLVRHGKYFTTYNKLASVNVSKGQKVSAGSIVGKAAADFDGGGAVEFRIMDSKGNNYDPERWLKR